MSPAQSFMDLPEDVFTLLNCDTSKPLVEVRTFVQVATSKYVSSRFALNFLRLSLVIWQNFSFQKADKGIHPGIC